VKHSFNIYYKSTTCKYDYTVKIQKNTEYKPKEISTMKQYDSFNNYKENVQKF